MVFDGQNLVATYRTFHPTTMEYTFFLNSNRIFTKMYHILGHKTKLSKFKEIIEFSAYDGIKLEISNGMTTGKSLKLENGN